MKRRINLISHMVVMVLLFAVSLSFGQAPSINYYIPSKLMPGDDAGYPVNNTGGPVYPEGYVKTIAGNWSPTNFGLEGNALNMGFGFFRGMVYDPEGNVYFF